MLRIARYSTDTVLPARYIPTLDVLEPSVGSEVVAMLVWTTSGQPLRRL